MISTTDSRPVWVSAADPTRRPSRRGSGNCCCVRCEHRVRESGLCALRPATRHGCGRGSAGRTGPFARWRRFAVCRRPWPRAKGGRHPVQGVHSVLEDLATDRCGGLRPRTLATTWTGRRASALDEYCHPLFDPPEPGCGLPSVGEAAALDRWASFRRRGLCRRRHAAIGRQCLQRLARPAGACRHQPVVP